jgi:hypothetical protein
LTSTSDEEEHRMDEEEHRMSEEPITDAPKPAEEQDAPAQERPPGETGHRPSQAEGDDDEDDD